MDEQTRIYAEVLSWFLIVLAAGGVPIVLGGLAVMVMQLVCPMDKIRMPPPPPPYPKP